MIKKKYSEGIKLSAQRKGLPKLAQQYVIISDEQVELAKKCVLYLTRQMREYQSNEYNVLYGCHIMTIYLRVYHPRKELIIESLTGY